LFGLNRIQMVARVDETLAKMIQEALWGRVLEFTYSRLYFSGLQSIKFLHRYIT
jgi:hypothetical protein